MALNNEHIANTQRLYDALTSGKGLQGIVDTALDIFENPVLVADTTFKVLAHAETPGIKNSLWEETIKSGFFPSEYILSIERDVALYNKVFSSETPEVVSDGVYPYRYMSKMIKVNGKTVGFATCVENQGELTESDARVFKVFCDVVGTELRSDEQFARFYSRRQDVFISEMINSPVKADFLEERLRQVGLRVRNYNFILTAQLADEETKREHHLAYFCKTLEQIIPDSYWIVYLDSLVALICRDTPDLLTEDFKKSILSYIETADMICGVSRCFRNLSEMSTHYKQSKKAIYIGRRLGSEERIFDYTRMSFFHMADIVGQTEELRLFCDPKLSEIFEYDETHSTQYAKMVYDYMRFDRNPAKTAKYLDIHRNTIDYRVKKIEELFEIDFNDRETAFSIDLSYRILKYLDALPF